MKPIPLLLLAGIASSAPIFHPTDCDDYISCQTAQQQPISRPRTPTHLLPGPRFRSSPSSSPSSSIDIAFDNAPQTPPENTNPTEALSSETPLTSAYLMSLTTRPEAPNPIEPAEQEKQETELAPVDPNTAHPSVRQEEMERYLSTHYPTTLSQPSPSPPHDESILSPPSPATPHIRCGNYFLSVDAISSLGSNTLGLEYIDNDLLVVGIVLLFLGIVICIELAQKTVEIRRAVFGDRVRRGEIWLDGCEFQRGPLGSAGGSGKVFRLGMPPVKKGVRAEGRGDRIRNEIVMGRDEEKGLVDGDGV